MNRLHQELNSNLYYVYLLSPDTIILSSIQNTGSQTSFCCDYGEMNFSPDGNKLVSVAYPGVVNLFDFDRCTGTLSNFVDLSDNNEWSSYGDSFSPDGSKLYVSSFKNLYQFDLNASNILQSKELIWANPYFDLDAETGYGMGQQQLAPNGKIYIVLGDIVSNVYVDTFIDRSLCVINKPNAPGMACDFVADEFDLGGKRARVGLPNSPNYNLGPLVGSPCDTLFNSVQTTCSSKDEVSVFPNPANEQVIVTVNSRSSNNNKFLLYDLYGNVKLSYSLSTVTNAVSLQNLAAGVYMYEVRNDVKSIARGKLVKI